MMRSMRPDRMTYAVQTFIDEKLGSKYVENRSVEFAKSFEESGNIGEKRLMKAALCWSGGKLEICICILSLNNSGNFCFSHLLLMQSWVAPG